MKKQDIINYFIQSRGYTKYLEIGVDKGHCFRAVECEVKESVDPAQGQYSHATPTYTMTSDDFFNSIDDTQKWDIILVDGLHHSDQVYKDVVNSLEHLNEGGVVICHDMNPLSEGAQAVPRSQSHWNGDCWKAWVQLRSELDHNMVVVNTDQGCGVIDTKHQSDSPLALELESPLTYSFLNNNREELLNLLSVDEWKTYRSAHA